MNDLRSELKDEAEYYNLTGIANRKFRQKLMAGEITFDWNGHYRSRKTKPVFPPKYEYEFRKEFGLEESFGDILMLTVTDLSIKNFKKLLLMLDNPTNEYIPLRTVASINMCGDCGDKIKFSFNGDTVKVATKCKHPKGHPPVEVYISVPSGKLVFENYFVGANPPDDSGLMGAVSNKYDTEHYAHQNVGYGFCGNSCPGVWLKGKTNIIMGREGHDNNDKVIAPFTGYKQVGSVTTDLWAWSTADMETAKKLGWTGDRRATVVDVKPGVYKVSQLFHLVGEAYDNFELACKYATIEFSEKL